MLLGCIGDDFTGSSDLANTLAKGGMRATQYCGVPSGPADADVEAGIVALKSRTIAPAEAVALSLEAAEWLLDQGCRQFLFKYCSTFDSTPEGNIGPVIDALMERLGADRTVICPAFPATGRSVYQGHLFVGDRPLNESGMENHPLTPMTDASIRRWVSSQTMHKVGHVGMQKVLGGSQAIEAALDEEVAEGRPVIVVDAIRDDDLHAIGHACRDWRLLTGGSGIALGLPQNFREKQLLAGGQASWSTSNGPGAVLAGSCSDMTRKQVEYYRAEQPSLEIEPDELMAGRANAAEVAEWALAQRSQSAPLVFTSADPDAVRLAQERHGREKVAGAIEAFFADLARRLVDGGIERLVVAGGETSGAVVEGLDLSALDIGPEIAAGVPAVKAADRPVWLSLKSGNFGDENFFRTALSTLEGRAP